jgi:hypothetical protein
MGSIARVVLRSPASFYCIVSIMMLIKWAMWFPIMLIRYGLSDALDAALTTSAGHPHAQRQIGLTTIWRRMSLLWHPQTH